MEKQKLKKIILNKVSTLMPTAILAAAALNFSSCATAQPTQTSRRLEAPTAVTENYTSNTKALKKLLNSDLNDVRDTSMPEAEVQKKLSKLLIEMNKESFKLANYYQNLEQISITNSALSQNEMKEISVARGQNGTTDAVNMQVAKVDIQHFLHLATNTLAGVRMGADEMQIAAVAPDERDQHNEYIRFNIQGERNIRKETEAVLNLIVNDVLAYANYGHQVANKNGNIKQNAINTNLNNLKTRVNATKQTSANIQEIEKLITETAAQLPASLFDSMSARQDLIEEIVKNYDLINLLNNLEKLGYKVNEIKLETIANNNTNYNPQPKTEFEAINTKASVTNHVAGLGVGADFKTTFNDNFSLKYGPEYNLQFGFDGSVNNQILGKVAPTFQINDNNELMLISETGIKFGTDGFRFADNFGVKDQININRGFSISVGGQVRTDVNENFTSVMVNPGIEVDLIYHTKKKCNIIFTLGFDYIKTWERNTNINPAPIPGTDPEPEPENPDDPGKIPTNNPDDGNESDSGDINDIPEDPYPPFDPADLEDNQTGNGTENTPNKGTDKIPTTIDRGNINDIDDENFPKFDPDLLNFKSK